MHLLWESYDAQFGSLFEPTGPTADVLLNEENEDDDNWEVDYDWLPLVLTPFKMVLSFKIIAPFYPLLIVVELLVEFPKAVPIIPPVVLVTVVVTVVTT